MSIRSGAYFKEHWCEQSGHNRDIKYSLHQFAYKVTAYSYH